MNNLIKELKIGNAVLYYGQIAFVLGIHAPTKSIDKCMGSHVVEITSIDNSFDAMFVNIDDLEPVLITEDLLPQLDFELSEYMQREYNLYFNDISGSFSYFKYKFFKNGRVDYYLNGIEESVKNIKDMKIKYLHQLQNIYFFSAYEEMKLNLK